MFIKIPSSRKWMHIVFRGYEMKCFDGEREFYRYLLKSYDVKDLVDEEELARDISRMVISLMKLGYTVDEIIEEVSVACGIPERDLRDLVERIFYEYGLYEKNGIVVGV
jgi:hypothetical protein